MQFRTPLPIAIFSLIFSPNFLSTSDSEYWGLVSSQFFHPCVFPGDPPPHKDSVEILVKVKHHARE